MDAPKCRLCGDRHYGLCITKSTAALTEVQSVETKRPALRKSALSTGASDHGTGSSPVSLGAGTQARPVDTRSREESGALFLSPPPLVTTSPGTVGDKDRGPKRKGDRHAAGYMAAYMRRYRAKKRGVNDGS